MGGGPASDVNSVDRERRTKAGIVEAMANYTGTMVMMNLLRCTAVLVNNAKPMHLSPYLQ